MLRRIFVGMAVIGLLILASYTSLPSSTVVVRPLLITFFFMLLFVQVWPLVMTLRGHFGKRWHPVNTMFEYFSALGILGTVGVAIVVFLHSTRDLGGFMLLLTGPMMFLGIVGSAVLAFFAAPWRDWTYHRHPKVPQEPHEP